MWERVANESGQAGTEYALIIVSIIMCAIAVSMVFSHEAHDVYKYIIDRVGDVLHYADLP